MPAPDHPRELEALARKYRALGVLRAARDGGGSDPGAAVDDRWVRGQLALLAREFPGCLRELDTLGATELARRAQAAAAAASGAPGEPWMAWIAAYHRLMRATLAIKAAVARGKGKEIGDDAATALARQVSQAAEIAVDVGFVRAIATPPEGRLGIVVMRALAAHFQTTAAELAAALFPPRRPHPYQW